MKKLKWTVGVLALFILGVNSASASSLVHPEAQVVDPVVILGESFATYTEALKVYTDISNKLTGRSESKLRVFLKNKSTNSDAEKVQIQVKVANAVSKSFEDALLLSEQTTKNECLKKIQSNPEYIEFLGPGISFLFFGVPPKEYVEKIKNQSIESALEQGQNQKFVFIRTDQVGDVVAKEIDAKGKDSTEKDQNRNSNKTEIKFSEPKFEYYRFDSETVAHLGIQLSDAWLLDETISIGFWRSQITLGIISNLIPPAAGSDKSSSIEKELIKCLYL